MKTNPNRRNNIVVLALVGAATLATTITLWGSQQWTKTPNLVSKSLFNSNQRSATDNVSNLQNVTNPDEVFFTSPKLDAQDPWKPNSTPGGKPESGKPTGTVDDQKAKYFTNLKSKAEALPGEAKNELIEIATEVEKFLKFKKLHSDWFEKDMEKTLKWTDVEENIRASLGNPKDNFADIEGIKKINEVLKQISGLTEEQNVETIKSLSYKAITKSNMVSDPTTPAPFNRSGKNVEEVAGTGFKNLIKIAEIDLSKEENFVLEYSYKNAISAKQAQSYLIIKNDKGQIGKAKTLEEAYQNLDIFGRYETSSSAIGAGSYKSEQESVVLKRDSAKKKLEVLVRLKETDLLSDIKFSHDHGQPDKFGILDVQADGAATFSAIIDKNNENAPGQLMQKPDASQPNKDEQLTKIQFFSTQYLSKKLTGKPLNDSDANRYIEFYQGLDEEYEFSTDLNYVTKYDPTTQHNDYEPIKEYIAGVATNKTVSLNLKFSKANEGSMINGTTASTYSFFALLKDNMDEAVAKLFPEVSLIKATSTAKNKIAKQRIEYSDKFYLLGNPRNKTAVDTSGDLVNQIPNMLDKVFYEKPVVFDQANPNPFKASARNAQAAAPAVASTLQASEQVDERANAVQLLGEIYNKWAQNDPGLTNFKYSFDAPQVTFEPGESDYKNITITRATLSGNGYQLYQGLNRYWAQLSDLIKFFNPSFTGLPERFWVSATNSAALIVDKFFVNNFEFIPNYAQVDALLAEAIRILNNSPSANFAAAPTLEQLPPALQRDFSAILAKLLAIQYEAIVKEFEANQLLPLYQEFATALNSATKQNRWVVNDQAAFLTTTTVNTNTAVPLTLLQYAEEGWNNITTQKETTLKEQLITLINLLNFGNISGEEAILADAIFANPLVALKFKGFSAEHLVDFSKAQPVSTKLNQLRILDGLLGYFGYTFSDPYGAAVSAGAPTLRFKYNGKLTDLSFAQVVDEIVQQLGQQTNVYNPTVNESYKSYWLDNIIAGTNIIRTLNWKLHQLHQGNTLFKSNLHQQQRLVRASQDALPSFTPQEVAEKIRAILAQQQGLPAEQAAWQNVMIGSKDFDKFARAFSGRNVLPAVLAQISGELTKDSVIMARRTIDYNEGYLAPLSQTLKYIWFITVALIGVGVMSAATVSVIAKAKEAKLSTHPVVMWFLFGLIVLGLSVAALALTFGVPTVL